MRRRPNLSLKYHLPMAKVSMSAKCEEIAEFSVVTPIRAVSVEALARLMVDAYEGTADWEDGDDVHVAEFEIRATLAGEYGEFNAEASAVILGESGEPVSALFASKFEGRETILFVYTAKSAQGQGHASKLIRHAAYQLQRSGVEDLYLFVSVSNPARLLYEKLGFSKT